MQHNTTEPNSLQIFALISPYLQQLIQIQQIDKLTFGCLDNSSKELQTTKLPLSQHNAFNSFKPVETNSE
jgi:hypothetical protein